MDSTIMPFIRQWLLVRSLSAGRSGVVVRVRFTTDVAGYVEESRTHLHQRFERQDDGSLIAEFGVDDTGEIKSWIMSFGVHALVLQPTSLRAEIFAELQDLAKRYDTP